MKFLAIIQVKKPSNFYAHYVLAAPHLKVLLDPSMLTSRIVIKYPIVSVLFYPFRLNC